MSSEKDLGWRTHSSPEEGDVRGICPKCEKRVFFDPQEKYPYCICCEQQFSADQAIRKDLGESELIQRLADGPILSTEMDVQPSRIRPVVDRLRIEVGGKGSRKRREHTSSGIPVKVYYLVGDERRAVQKLIEEHEDIIGECLEDDNNPFRRYMDDAMYQMLQEQWNWHPDVGDQS